MWNPITVLRGSGCGGGGAEEDSALPGGAQLRQDRDMSIAELPIKIEREKIAEFCRARGMRRLSLFGSVLIPFRDSGRVLQA